MQLISAIELVIMLNQDYKTTTKESATHFCSVKQDGMEFEIFIKRQDKSLPDLEELKKEFEDNFGNPNKEYILQEDRAKLWQWFSSKLSEYVPKSEYHSDLAKVTFQGLDEQKLIQQLTAQIAKLKAENEQLKESMSGDRIEMAILKAENEKLKTRNKTLSDVNTDLKNAIAVNAISRKEELTQTRTEERAKKLGLLKAEVAEARSEKLGYFIFKDTCGERVNKEIYDKYDGFKQVLPIETDRIKAEARKEERERIISTIQLIKFNPVLDATEERINGILSHIVNVIEPQQPKPPQECYDEFGLDLDSCSRQQNEGCKGCRCLTPQSTKEGTE